MDLFTNISYSGGNKIVERAFEEYFKCVFYHGELIFNESHDLKLNKCVIYCTMSLWHNHALTIDSCVFENDAAASLWYCTKLDISKSRILSDKAIRECSTVTMNMTLAKSDRLMWHCHNVIINDSGIYGDNFLTSSTKITINDSKINGKYALQHLDLLTAKNTTIASKEGLWNVSNSKFTNCVFHGDRVGWHSNNLTFINCTFFGDNLFNYSNDITFKDCKFIDTKIAFHHSRVSGSIIGDITTIDEPHNLNLEIKGHKEPKVITSEDTINSNISFSLIDN